MIREFIFERATKNTYRFAEDGQPPAGPARESMENDANGVIVGVLYVQKHAFKTQPSRIRVTVEEVTP